LELSANNFQQMQRQKIMKRRNDFSYRVTDHSVHCALLGWNGGEASCTGWVAETGFAGIQHRNTQPAMFLRFRWKVNLLEIIIALKLGEYHPRAASCGWELVGSAGCLVWLAWY
jgi:hypothetical protein